MTTPEGRVKQAVKKVLDQYKGTYTYWPVPAGYGPSSLDCLICIRGLFVAIETKAPGKKPTSRQKFVIEQIERAGGKVFVIDNIFGTAELDNYLKGITHASSSNKPQT